MTAKMSWSIKHNFTFVWSCISKTGKTQPSRVVKVNTYKLGQGCLALPFVGQFDQWKVVYDQAGSFHKVGQCFTFLLPFFFFFLSIVTFYQISCILTFFSCHIYLSIVKYYQDSHILPFSLPSLLKHCNNWQRLSHFTSVDPIFLLYCSFQISIVSIK